MDEQTTDPTPEPTDALDALMAAPEAAEPEIDPIGRLMLDNLAIRADLAALAREVLGHGVGGGERYATIARIAQDPDAQPDEL